MVEHVDTVAFLPRGTGPSRKLAGEHDFVTPSLSTPKIARTTIWTASQQSAEEVLVGVEVWEAEASRKELLRRVHGVRVLLDWLRGFAGESWQQRWLVSGTDVAGRA